MTVAKYIIEKVFSGRFLLTVFFGASTCIGFLNKLIPSEAFVGITVLIVQSYFQRSDRDKENGTNGTKP